jgi:hypothetical protein
MYFLVDATSRFSSVVERVTRNDEVTRSIRVSGISFRTISQLGHPSA